MDESIERQKSEIAELRRRQEELKKEGDKKKRELEKLRAENRARLNKTRINHNQESDDDDDYYFKSYSYGYSFDSRPKSEYDLKKTGIKENQKLIKLKHDMYIEDKKRCWMPYCNKYDMNDEDDDEDDEDRDGDGDSSSINYNNNQHSIFASLHDIFIVSIAEYILAVFNIFLSGVFFVPKLIFNFAFVLLQNILYLVFYVPTIMYSIVDWLGSLFGFFNPWNKVKMKSRL